MKLALQVLGKSCKVDPADANGRHWGCRVEGSLGWCSHKHGADRKKQVPSCFSLAVSFNTFYWQSLTWIQVSNVDMFSDSQLQYHTAWYRKVDLSWETITQWLAHLLNASPESPLAFSNGSSTLHQSDLSKALQSFLWSHNKGKDPYYDPKTLHKLTPRPLCCHVGLPSSPRMCHVLASSWAFGHTTPCTWNIPPLIFAWFRSIQCWDLRSGTIISLVTMLFSNNYSL